MMAQMDNDPKMANKPEQVKAKIVDGKISKFYAENCLLQQDFVKDGEFTVEKYIAAAAKALLAEGVEVGFSADVKSGFKVGEKNGGYYISFSDESFEALLSGYLRDKVAELLFKA